MRSENLLLSIAHLISLIFYLCIGCFILSAAVSTSLRVQLETFVHSMHQWLEPKSLLLIGGLFLGYGIFLLVLLLMGIRRVYYRVALKGSQVMIDHSIVQDYVEHYFKDLFPVKTPKVELIFHPRQRLEILTKFPEHQEKEALLKRIENELGILLARKLGYKEEFILSFREV